MLLNSAKLTANEAKLRGFVTEVFPHDSLKRNTMALIEKCAKRSGEVCIVFYVYIHQHFMSWPDTFLVVLIKYVQFKKF